MGPRRRDLIRITWRLVMTQAQCTPYTMTFNSTKLGVDLMFAGPGVDVEAMKPWPEPDGHWKKLGLGAAPGGIRWRILSDTEAQYTVYKDRRPGSIETDPHTLNAKLVYRRSRPL
jgi:hypothetical protein